MTDRELVLLIGLFLVVLSVAGYLFERIGPNPWDVEIPDPELLPRFQARKVER